MPALDKKDAAAQQLAQSTSATGQLTQSTSATGQSNLAKAYAKSIAADASGDPLLVDVYNKHFVLEDEELKSQFDEVKNMTLMDDDDVLETVYSHAVGFNDKNKNWIFTFLTNEYKVKYPNLTSKTSIWEWLCFVIIMIVYDGQESLKTLKNSNYSGINVDTANVGKRKRLRVTSRTLNSTPRIESRPVHPLEMHDYYSNRKILFSVGRALEYIIPGMFAPLKAKHMLSTQKIKVSGTEVKVPSIKIDVTPGYVVNLNDTVVNRFKFSNYDCPEIVNYIESLVGKSMKLKFGLKIGTRTTPNPDKNLIGEDDNQKSASLSYVVIKSLSIFIEHAQELYLGIRSYDSLKITVGNNILLDTAAFEKIIEKFNDADIEKHSQMLDAYAINIAAYRQKINALPKSSTTGTSDSTIHTDTTLDATAPTDIMKNPDDKSVDTMEEADDSTHKDDDVEPAKRQRQE